MLPKIQMVGRLVREPEQRFTQSGSSVVSFDLVSSEKYKDKEDTCFISCTVFGALGEKVVMPYLHKGSKIYVSGKLKFEQWTAQDGSKRSRHVIHIDSMEMLDQKQDGAQQHNNMDDPQRHNVAGAMNRPSRDQQAAQKPIHTPPVPEMDMSEVPF